MLPVSARLLTRAAWPPPRGVLLWGGQASSIAVKSEAAGPFDEADDWPRIAWGGAGMWRFGLWRCVFAFVCVCVWVLVSASVVLVSLTSMLVSAPSPTASSSLCGASLDG